MAVEVLQDLKLHSSESGAMRRSAVSGSTLISSAVTRSQTQLKRTDTVVSSDQSLHGASNDPVDDRDLSSDVLGNQRDINLGSDESVVPHDSADFMDPGSEDPSGVENVDSPDLQVCKLTYCI